MWLCHIDGTLVHPFDKRAHRVVFSVAVTLDGQHIISGSDDKLVKVWSVASKSLVSTCEGHTSYVWAVAAMPDGQRILSGSDNGRPRVAPQRHPREDLPELHTEAVVALVALPDNQHALSGSHGGTIKLFNVNDGAVLRTFEHNTNAVRSLALLPDGLRFVSGSDDDTARVFEHGLALAPTAASSEIKLLLKGAEAELRRAQQEARRAQEEARLAQEQVGLAQQKVRSLQQKLAAAK